MILQSKLLALVNEVLGQTALLRKGGQQAVYFCPKCNHYKRKLEISIDGNDFGKYHCWVCDFKGVYLGSLFTKVKAPQRYRDELFTLTKDLRLNRKSKDTEEEEEILQLPESFISLAEHFKRIEYTHSISYLKKRGIGINDICRYNIGVCTYGDYRDCIVVPSYDGDGRLNYFSGRYIYPNSPFKYRNATGSKNIIGFESFVNYSEPVTLVEGVFDAIAVRRNAIPLFGTSVSKKLREALYVNKTPRVNLVLDNDAVKYAIRIAQELWKWGIVVHLVRLKEKDPSEIGFDRITDLIESAPVFDYKQLIDRLLE